MTIRRIFLLSPAHCGGKRAQMLIREQASFPLARQLRRPEGVPLGEAFTFLSGLYFRGKVAYAQRFASCPEDALVITTNRGLAPLDSRITAADLRDFGCVDIATDDAAYREPLVRDCNALAEGRSPVEVVLLGSIATGKYVDILLNIFGDRLLFPTDFVGRGDMSRGAIMLRAAESGKELLYEPVAGAVRRGRRAPRVESRKP